MFLSTWCVKGDGPIINVNLHYTKRNAKKKPASYAS